MALHLGCTVKARMRHLNIVDKPLVCAVRPVTQQMAGIMEFVDFFQVVITVQPFLEKPRVVDEERIHKGDLPAILLVMFT